MKTLLAEVYDIITVSETHLHAGVPNEIFEIKGFHEIIRKDRNGNGGGVAMYIKNSVSYKRIFKYEENNLEAVWVQVNTIEGIVVTVLLIAEHFGMTSSMYWMTLKLIV